MTNTQRKQCESIIHSSAIKAAAAAAATAPTPVPDATVIVPIQVDMIRKLSSVFNLDEHSALVQDVLGPMLATAGGKSVANWLLGKIPVAGSIINGSTTIVITEALGWSVVATFDV